jgi:hypothetical protein
VKLIAYPTSGTAPDIRPSPATRDWMDALPEGFGYRCLPLNIANMHGWEIACPRGFRARWDGGVGGAIIASMAQVYPEDRGTNYAIRDGRRAAALIDAWLDRTVPGTFPGPGHC